MKLKNKCFNKTKTCVRYDFYFVRENFINQTSDFHIINIKFKT